jgi:thioredoxin 1
MKAINYILTGIILMAGIVITPCFAQQQVGEEIKTIEQSYPGLTAGMLTYAKADTLPNGILLKTSDIQITQSDINDIISKQPQQMQQDLNNNAFFVLEQEATRRILQHLAKESVTQSDKVKPNQDDPNILQQFFEKDVFKKIEVADEELKTFYENNKDMCGGATLEQIGPSLKEYLIDQKKQQMADDYIHTLGKKISIQVSGSWVKKRAALAFDNPVDKARKSGKPFMVDFGASGCRPCDMMAPILETLRKKYEGKFSVIFVHVREQQILAFRYGVQTIPLQVFFDKTGKEVFRHIGFFPQEEIEKKINELAVK